MMPKEQNIQYTDGLSPKPPSDLQQNPPQSHKAQKNKYIYIHLKRKKQKKINVPKCNS
jgi:hypothetical protein